MIEIIFAAGFGICIGAWMAHPDCILHKIIAFDFGGAKTFCDMVLHPTARWMTPEEFFQNFD